ncbi:MAG: nucleotidyltransferase domain-containing protein [candidate division KSB1 bacterium]|nr:nucleotidyltransferase domain-containing protein [candidate division KSB1 bacterium]
MAHTTIDDALVESIVSKIAEAIQPEKIILFGSGVKGSGQPNSDIDLLIVTQASSLQTNASWKLALQKTSRS